MGKSLKKKKIITVVLVVLLVMVYVMIFSFSAENGEASSDASVKITKWLVKIYYRLINGFQGNSNVILETVAETEGSIRKLAHFIEYMAVGFLSLGIAVMWVEHIGKAFMLIVVQLIVSAGCDEIHQYFVPGRYSSIKDVMIDTTGGIAGMLVILCIMGIRKQWKHIRRLK